MDKSVWKISPLFFTESLGDIVLEPRLTILLTRRFTLFGLNSRSVLLELTDNLFNVIHENMSLIQDSIVEKADEAIKLRKKTMNKFVSSA